MMDIRVQGYENQVKLFLVLLVLFLVAAGVIGLNALYRTQALLIQEAEGRIISATRAVQRELTDAGISRPAADPAARSALGSRLRDLGRAYSISSLEIVDPEGQVLAATQPWRLGVIDPAAAEVGRFELGGLSSGGAVIRESAAALDDPEYGPDRGEVLVFLPLVQGSSGPEAILKAGHEVIGVRTVSRQIRFLAWTQAIAGLVVLALALLFVRWVLRPYRALRAAASQIQARGPSQVADDPEDLISSFRGVIDKLKEQERELEGMRALSNPGGPAALSQEMLNGLTSGVLIVGSQGRIVALNPAGEAILGAGRDRIVGRDFREVFSRSPELLSILKDGVEAGRPHSREVVPYEGGGAQAHLGVTISAIPGAGAGRGGAFCLFSDLTEIRGLQERVRVKENLAGLGEMSAGIAHEFRNSLATILGYARLIGRQAGASSGGGGEADGAGSASHAAAIAREVQLIGRIVDDFLRYAKPASLQASEWDPGALMAEVVREISRDSGRPGVTILLRGDWPPAIRADQGLLRQAFGNLLRNAVEAIPGDSGLVTVTACLEEEGEQLRIEVADSGTGIPPEVLGRLFTPFVTTKERGTGLGLALTQKAIVCHDGAISAGNSDAGGARFVIRLPLQI